jgi:hypothetical protein
MFYVLAKMKGNLLVIVHFKHISNRPKVCTAKVKILIYDCKGTLQFAAYLLDAPSYLNWNHKLQKGQVLYDTTVVNYGSSSVIHDCNIVYRPQDVF